MGCSCVRAYNWIWFWTWMGGLVLTFCVFFKMGYWSQVWVWFGFLASGGCFSKFVKRVVIRVLWFLFPWECRLLLKTCGCVGDVWKWIWVRLVGYVRVEQWWWQQQREFNLLFWPVLVDFVAAVLVAVRSWMGEAPTKVDHHHQTPVRPWRLRD